MRTVLIQGSGVAALCSAHLLRKAGVDVRWHGGLQARVPVVVVGDASLALLRDIFDRPDLFRDSPRIRKRIVAWERGRDAFEVEHHASVISERELFEELGICDLMEDSGSCEPAWTIYASRPLPAAIEEHGFGSRVAAVMDVRLKDGVRGDACWIESLDSGWLFLIPDTEGSGWLISVGDAPQTLLGFSDVIARQIDSTGEALGSFPSFPRIVSPLCGPGWLACGSAAMAFDPLCGDGTANAVRESILASAVVRAVLSNGDGAGLLRHYQHRLTSGFQRHLALCREFYANGRAGEWWRKETDALETGLRWCDAVAGGSDGFDYRLSGYDLERVGIKP